MRTKKYDKETLQCETIRTTSPLKRNFVAFQREDNAQEAPSVTFEDVAIQCRLKTIRITLPIKPVDQMKGTHQALQGILSDLAQMKASAERQKTGILSDAVHSRMLWKTDIENVNLTAENKRLMAQVRDLQKEKAGP